ncbi:MAG: S41 family peptidase, partial [Acutalibacteraceae bacterium]|nr:S41 family peptidase [Acutalibacteraceae bacterium]
LILSDFIIQSVFTDKIDNYGYVEITTFNDKTVAQFKEKVNALIEEGVKGLIFNVADNGGGTLDSVIEILDFLLPEGVIVSVEYNDGVRKVIGKSDEKEIDLPMAVIINSSTASAAELFAASIRDYEKGAIIGEKSFGKGVMQKTYRLYDRSAIRFTVARYYSKNGVSYNKKGIEPDINVVLTKEQKMNYYFTSDRENPYVIKAVEYLNGK